jgi:hypothetical protein
MRKLRLLLTFFIFTPLFLFSLLFSFLTLSYALTQPTYISAHNVSFAALPTNQGLMEQSVESKDARVEMVQRFLADSPLEQYADFIVETADKYDFDYRYIPAIAMQESNRCKRIPANSYNCWGFGIYGGKVTRFTDYKHGIEIVTKALAIRYKGHGLETPEEIMSMYNPSNHNGWAANVTQFMATLEIPADATVPASDSAK